MAGRDWTQEPFQVVIPPGAGPNDPRIEIGFTLPADLVAYYSSAHGFTSLTGGIIMFASTTDYIYLVWGISLAGTIARFALGSRNSSGVRETLNIEQATSDPLMNFYQYFPGVASFTNGGILEFLNAGSTLQLYDGAVLGLGVAGSPCTVLGTSASVIDVDDTCPVNIDQLAHGKNVQNTASTTASTSYANLTNIAGKSFVAPASGRVTFHFTAEMSNSSAAGGALLAPRIGTGSTVGSGTEVLAATPENGLIFVQHSTAGEELRYGGHYTHEGLTPGTTYNVSMQGRAASGGGTATITRIATTIVPSP